MSDLFTPGPLEYLAAVWGNGPHSLCWRGSPWFMSVFPATPVEMMERSQELHGRNLWFGAHPLKAIPEGRGKGVDVLEVLAIPADLDWAHRTRRTEDVLPTEAEVRDRLRALGAELQPSVVVNSGHGLQPSWLLAYAVPPEEGQELADRFTAALAEVGLDNGRQDLASILRLPGTDNVKDPDDVRPVVIEQMDLDRKFVPEWLRKNLPPVPAGRSRVGGATRHRPGAVTDEMQRLADVLVDRYRGQSGGMDRNGELYLTRPGKPVSEGNSASIITGDAGDALLTVYTDRWPEVPEAPHQLTKGKSYVLGLADDWLYPASDPLRGMTINASGPGVQSVNTTGRNLPDEFWQARPWLTELRAWAHAHAVAADSIYAVVRARLAVLVSPKVRVDTGILTPVPLNLLTVLLGASGIGKTTAANLGRQVIDWGLRVDVLEATLGSGEGIAEAYLGAAPSKGAPRPQLYQGVLFTLDEGAALHELKERNAATLMSELRKAFSGTTLGQFNADATRRRQVPEYRFGLLANMQPSVAVKLLGNHETGDPQRFTWFATTDPSIPDLAPSVPVPKLPPITHGWLIPVAPSITAELHARRLAVVKGARLPDPLDSQRDACRANEAGMQALMDGRTAVTEDDWRLAGMVMDVSDVLRREVMAQHRAQRIADDEAQGKRQGVREAAAETERERRLVAELSKRLVAKVEQGPPEGIGKGELERLLTNKGTRHRFGPALDLAVRNLRVEVVKTESGERVRLRKP
jgi:hypothetical protein